MGDVVGPPVPRVRRHPGGDHHHLRRGLADPDPDDVLAHPQAQPGRKGGPLLPAYRKACFERMIAFYGRTLKVVLRYQTLTLLVAVATLALTIFLYIIIPKGFFPVQDTGVIQGISQAPASISFTAMVKAQQELAKIILQDPGGRKPVLLYWGRRHQHHAEQRPHVDQSETARPARSERLRRHPPAQQLARPGQRISSSTCSRCRTSPSTTASAVRNISTRSKIPT